MNDAPLTDIGLQNIAPVAGKKSDLAYQALKRAIILRHYAPGSQILEQSVAASFHCSQSTVREALLNLSKDGLVERRGYSGTFVTDTSPAEAATMVKIRLCIERNVAAACVTSQLSEDHPVLTDLLSQMDQAHTNGDLYQGSELDRAFHSELANATGMALLSPLLQRCALHIHRFTLGSVEVPREFFQTAGIGEEHRQLLSRLCSGSTVDAQKAVVEHLASVLERWSPSLYRQVNWQMEFEDIEEQSQEAML